MICNKCNHRLPDDSEFCQYCGTPITHNEDIFDMEDNKIVTDVTESSESSQIKKTPDKAFTESPRINQTAETLTEKLPVKDSHPIHQPQIVNVIEQTNTNVKKIRKKRVRYCSRCGSLINNETKQCTGCGKKYFKVRFTKLTVTILILTLLLLTSTIINFVQLSRIKYLNNRFNSLINLSTENSDDWFEFSFFRDNAVIVGDDNTNKYHKYGCYKLDDSNGYWIFNTEAAVDQGYKKCNLCN